MSIPIIDNLHYTGRKPDFDRQQYNLISDLKLVKDNRMPDMYLAYCLEDRSIYLYDKSSPVSTVTGKFRKFQTGNNIQVTDMPFPSEEFNNRVVQYIGTSNLDFTKGFFYNCHFLNKEINTVEDLKELLLQYGDTHEDNVKSIFYGETLYFIQNEAVYTGSFEDPIEVTDEDLGFTISTYVWEYLETSKKYEPDTIPTRDIDDLFVSDDN